MNMKIGKYKIGINSLPFVIAEVAQAHDGSLGQAYAFVDAVASTGVNAIKFQTHYAEYESSKFEKFRKGTFFPQDKTRYAYWKRMEFTPNDWSNLKKYTESKGLIFLSSAFSNYSFEVLKNLDMAAWKIGSGEFYNSELIEKMIKTKKVILISTGMSNFKEIKKLDKYLTSKKARHIFMHCSSIYPCPPDKINLERIDSLKEHFGPLVGFSDHSGTIFPSISAVTKGAKIIEVHVKLSKHGFGPDHSSSITIKELKMLVNGVKFINSAINATDNKNDERISNKKLFTKSAFAADLIKSGQILNNDNVIMKKPGIGISYDAIKGLIGKIAKKDIKAGDLLKREYFK